MISHRVVASLVSGFWTTLWIIPNALNQIVVVVFASRLVDSGRTTRARGRQTDRHHNKYKEFHMSPSWWICPAGYVMLMMTIIPSCIYSRGWVDHWPMATVDLPLKSLVATLCCSCCDCVLQEQQMMMITSYCISRIILILLLLVTLLHLLLLLLVPGTTTMHSYTFAHFTICCFDH